MCNHHDSSPCAQVDGWVSDLVRMSVAVDLSSSSSSSKAKPSSSSSSSLSGHGSVSESPSSTWRRPFEFAREQRPSAQATQIDSAESSESPVGTGSPWMVAVASHSEWGPLKEVVGRAVRVVRSGVTKGKRPVPFPLTQHGQSGFSSLSAS